jgi:hypothetical protein
VRRTPAALIVAVLAVLAPFAASAEAKGFNPCKALTPSRAGGFAPGVLQQPLPQGGDKSTCTYTDTGTIPAIDWFEELGVGNFRSTKFAHKEWNGEYKSALAINGGDVTVAKLKIKGTDEAFGVQTRSQSSGSIDSRVVWRNDQFVDRLEIRSPIDTPWGDLESVTDGVKILLKHVP